MRNSHCGFANVAIRFSRSEVDREARARISIGRILSGLGRFGSCVLDPGYQWRSDQLPSAEKQRTPQPGSVGPRGLDEMASVPAFSSFYRSVCRTARADQIPAIQCPLREGAYPRLLPSLGRGALAEFLTRLEASAAAYRDGIFVRAKVIAAIMHEGASRSGNLA